MEMKKLTEENLTRPPEEVFDILSKLGQGSYGSVFKAKHKDNNNIFAIKQVPVPGSDLQEVIKEISIMEQCDSPFVVKYFGSYFKNTEIWIVMEYCGVGSVLDIMKLRALHWRLPRGQVKSLTEPEIATILMGTLKGLEYLHLRKKIHRDIKAGNILLTECGQAKLGDFGVAGQLTDTLAKRNTLIGTPYWMAPEITQEIGYNCAADIWSLGITALEMAEGKAPYADINPMRFIFMIHMKPPPTFSQPDKWSETLIDFVSRCLVKNPESRATAPELLEHEFIKKSHTPDSLSTLIEETQAAKEELLKEPFFYAHGFSTLNNGVGSSSTSNGEGTLIENQALALKNSSGGEKKIPTLESGLGTMVINENDSTLKPEFLDLYDAKEAERKLKNGSAASNGTHSSNDSANCQNPRDPRLQPIPEGEATLYQNREKLANLEQDMEREIEELRRRFNFKLKPIVDQINALRKCQQNF
eukprot:04912.XXX_131361_132842_1 [CDS] Oithona nana genome sequencing.